MGIGLSQVLRAMSQAADLGEAKDLGHAQRVTLLALRLAAGIGIGERNSLQELAIAGLLHDLGMSAVNYALYQRFAGGERALLARFPSADDGLFGLPEHGSGSAALLSRHSEQGARLLQQLGLPMGAVEAVQQHHSRQDLVPTAAPPSLLAQLVGLADLLDVATCGLGTVDARRSLAAELARSLSGSLVDAELLASLHPILVDVATWESVFFVDEAEAELATLLDAAPLEGDELEAYLRTLAEVVDALSPYTLGHSSSVARLARRIGEHIGLEPEALERLYLASLVHGVGRLSIPSSILEKRGGLSADEFEALHAYPNLTRETLAPLRELAAVVDEASTHREKLDGSGYPDGREGDAIPLVGRILGVADTFVALSSERPYRPAYSRSRAVAIVQAESARLFDGLVADALETVYREGF